MNDQTLKERRENGLDLMLDYDKGGGVVEVIVQDNISGGVLMLGFANEEAFETTLEIGCATFYSRTVGRVRTKGEEESGNLLALKGVLVDCDQDAVIYQVEKVKDGACHTKDVGGVARNSCFYRAYNLKTGKLEYIQGMK